jgi:hypothetical protein
MSFLITSNEIENVLSVIEKWENQFTVNPKWSSSFLVWKYWLFIKIKDIEQTASIKAKCLKRKQWSQNTLNLFLNSNPLFTYGPTPSIQRGKVIGLIFLKTCPLSISIRNLFLIQYRIKYKNKLTNYLLHHFQLNLKHQHPLQTHLQQGLAY